MARILLLEDDPDICECVQLLLEAKGYAVRATPSGRTAVLLAARETFDLAVLDVDVEELSGLGAERAIADFASLPTVVFSASSGDWESAAFRAGATACLHKPWDVDRLPALVETLLGLPHEPRPIDVIRLPHEDVARLCALPPEKLEELPFGVIKLDRDGAIVGYNAYEAKAAERARTDIVGRRFAELAPCTQVKQFVDAVAEAFAGHELDRVLRFVFPCHGALAAVSVRLFYDADRDQLWLFVARRALRPADRIEAPVGLSPP